MPEPPPAVVTPQVFELMVTPAEPLPSVVAPVEESVVNAPVPGLVAPIDGKCAAPAPVTPHCASLRARSEPEAAQIVMVPPAVLPIVVSAVPDVLIVVVPVSARPPEAVSNPA